MPAKPRPRKPPAPVQGSVRWIKRPASPRHAGRLAITRVNDRGESITSEYAVAPLISGTDLVGYLLIKPADATTYAIDITVSPWTCECGDFVFRRESSNDPESHDCKHIVGLRKALAALEQTSAAG